MDLEDRRLKISNVVFLPIIGLILNGFIYSFLQPNKTAFIVIDIFFFILLPLVTLVFLYANNKKLTLNILKKTNTLTQIVDILIAIISLYFIYMVSVSVLKGFLSPNYIIPFYDGLSVYLKENNQFIKYIYIFYFSASAAIVEEIFFRRLLFVYFYRENNSKKSLLLYVFISSFLFMLSHIEQGNIYMFGALIYGIFSSLIYLNYKYLLPLVLSHFVINIIIYT